MPHRFGPTALATPANFVTVVRILGSIALVGVLLAGARDWALALFLVLALSDNVDGMLARRQGPTRSGAFLDPLADKVLVGGSLLALAWLDEVSWILVAVILVREVAMSAYRSHLAQRGVSVPASALGKAKTVVTLVGIGLVLVGHTPAVVGTIVLWVAAALAWISFVDYLRRAAQLAAEGERRDGGDVPVSPGHG